MSRIKAWAASFAATQLLGAIIWLIFSGMAYSSPHASTEASSWMGEAMMNTGFLSWWVAVTTLGFILLALAYVVVDEEEVREK